MSNLDEESNPDGVLGTSIEEEFANETYIWHFIYIDGVWHSCDGGAPCGPMSKEVVIKRIVDAALRRIARRDRVGYYPFAVMALGILDWDAVEDILEGRPLYGEDDELSVHWTHAMTGDMFNSIDISLLELEAALRARRQIATVADVMMEVTLNLIAEVEDVMVEFTLDLSAED